MNGDTANCGHLDVNRHIVKEVSELGDGELNSARGRSGENGGSGLDINLSVFETEGCEGLKVGIDEKDMGFLDIYEGWGRIGETLLLSRALDISDPLIEKLCGHEHLVCLAIICD